MSSERRNTQMSKDESEKSRESKLSSAFVDLLPNVSQIMFVV